MNEALPGEVVADYGLRNSLEEHFGGIFNIDPKYEGCYYGRALRESSHQEIIDVLLDD